MMSILNKSLNLFKKKLFYFIFIDGLFFISLFILLNYSRNKIQSYLKLIQQYIPQLDVVQSLLRESTTLENLEQSNLLLEKISSVMNEALFFGYLIIPLSIFILWVVFQGLSYKLISENNFSKILDYKFFMKFLILTLPFFIILTFAIFQFLAMFSDLIPYYGGIFNPTFMLFVITLGPLILFYFLFIFYSLLNNNSLLKTLKKGFLIAIKKIYFLFPLYLGYLTIFILFLVAFLNNFVFYIGNFNAFSIINLVITIVLLIIYSYYRTLFSSFSSSFSS
jgi:hypothetical protein|tara:strand:+ start:494 stop:1330 length:837 start_codon:yes stop_codon:yes gene_type:complete